MCSLLIKELNEPNNNHVFGLYLQLKHCVKTGFPKLDDCHEKGGMLLSLCSPKVSEKDSRVKSIERHEDGR